MNYIEYDFTVTPIELGVEILVAELAEVGFESFVDTPTGVKMFPCWRMKNLRFLTK